MPNQFSGITELWIEFVDMMVSIEDEPLLGTKADPVKIYQEWAERLDEMARHLADGVVAWLEGRIPVYMAREATLITARPIRVGGTPPAELVHSTKNAAKILRLLASIARHGPDASAAGIIKSARMDKQTARRLLRWLQLRGSYNGFARETPRLYRQ